jgi:hypothetical protein
VLCPSREERAVRAPCGACALVRPVGERGHSRQASKLATQAFSHTCPLVCAANFPQATPVCVCACVCFAKFAEKEDLDDHRGSAACSPTCLRRSSPPAHVRVAAKNHYAPTQYPPPPPPPARRCVVRGAKGPAPALTWFVVSHKDVIIPASPIPVAHVKTRIAADHAPHHGEAASQTRRAQ